MKLTKFLGLSIIVLLSFGCQPKVDKNWNDDFNSQIISKRPVLEVNYVDSGRNAFQIFAEDYQLIGQLEKPHLLKENDGKEWLWFEMKDSDGKLYSTKFSEEASRINLYRRGPYYCEVHWFDLKLVTKEGEVAPLKGELSLYCYPEKILAEIKWYGIGDLKAENLYVKGISSREYKLTEFQDGEFQAFSFPLFGETAPLSADAFTLINGEVPFKYDYRKGCYVVGTNTSNSFQEHFYDFPNRYETAKFSLKNDSVKRKIYVCHESVIGGAIVEGGILLNEEGQTMPVVVQVSKNFGGEKEEKFYNPLDTAFSETFFPLYLEPEESMTLTSLHLYQNWGKHMTKHWSSLGAWMDYFHSSTGVTETTCYVPFKFAGIGGVSIADFRAMSQETFWIGQPQHDNLAGHSFLSFYDGKDWQHMKYVSTIYRSTGPNWYDIQLNYISADSSIKVVADIWETPQADELRSFFNVRYEVLKPLVVENAKTDFRFLSITSTIQSLRFTRFAANGVDDQEIDFSQKPFPVKGISLPTENAFLAEYGDHKRQRGSNAIVIRKFEGPDGINPAATLQIGAYKDRFKHDNEADTRLLLVSDTDRLELNKGDEFVINGFWLPYGNLDNADTPRKMLEQYGTNSIKLDVSKGELLSELPLKIKAENDEAIFTMQGGKDLVPVIITGLSDYETPRIWQKEDGKWRMILHERNSMDDGYQVFCDDYGTFGAVFLIHSDSEAQELKVTLGKKYSSDNKMTVEQENEKSSSSELSGLVVGKENIEKNIHLSFPSKHLLKDSDSEKEISWKNSEGNSMWFQAKYENWKRGGRISPNQQDYDLEYWWQNNAPELKHDNPEFLLELEGTIFEDTQLERTWILTSEGWKKASLNESSAQGIIAVQSADGKYLLSMAWNNGSDITVKDGKVVVELKAISFANHKRYHVRGKLYLFEGNLESLEKRINRELNIF